LDSLLLLRPKGASSLQCGRRVDSLKWFLDWKFYAKQGFSDRVENYYQLAKFAQYQLEI
jgi:sulfinoalanine decarboxylase